jgi:hypothetical protein
MSPDALPSLYAIKRPIHDGVGHNLAELAPHVKARISVSQMIEFGGNAAIALRLIFALILVPLLDVNELRISTIWSIEITLKPPLNKFLSASERDDFQTKSKRFKAGRGFNWRARRDSNPRPLPSAGLREIHISTINSIF